MTYTATRKKSNGKNSSAPIKLPAMIETFTTQHLSKAKGSDAKVFLSLLFHADWRTGVAFPSINTIAAETGLADSSVSTSLKRLRESGAVEVTEPGSHRRSTRHRLSTTKQVKNLDDPGTPPNRVPRSTGEASPVERGRVPLHTGEGYPGGPGTNRDNKTKINKTKKSNRADFSSRGLLQSEWGDDELSEEQLAREVERLSDELGISQRLRDEAEAECPGSLLKALAITRGKYLCRELHRPPAAFATALIKKVAAKGASALMDAPELISDFKRDVADGLPSLTSDPDGDAAAEADALHHSIRDHCDEENAPALCRWAMEGPETLLDDGATPDDLRDLRTHANKHLPARDRDALFFRRLTS